MKRISAVFMLLLAVTASLILLLTRVESTLAQDVEPQFKVGERVEADLNWFRQQSEDVRWHKATITKVFEAMTRSPQKDVILVAVADALASRGSSHVIEASQLADLNIPYSKHGDLAAKRMTVTQRTESGKELVRAIAVIATEARYVLYTRSLTNTTYAVAVDETGTIVGRRKWPSPSRDLPIGVAQPIATNDYLYWANFLIPERVARTGVWLGMVSYRVKTDDGGEYTLGTSQLRPLTRAEK